MAAFFWDRVRLGFAVLAVVVVEVLAPLVTLDGPGIFPVSPDSQLCETISWSSGSYLPAQQFPDPEKLEPDFLQSGSFRSCSDRTTIEPEQCVHLGYQ